VSTRYLGGFITKSPTAPTTSAAPGIWTLDQALGYIKAGTWPSPAAPPSSQSYTTAGTYTWVAPVGVTSVSVVAVGGSGKVGGVSTYGQSGGGLGYKNNYSVTPGSSYSLQVGGCSNNGNSFFVNLCTVSGRYNCGNAGGTYTGDGGGNGGGTIGYAGGGAGGYSGNGGDAGSACSNGSNGAGGGGGGGKRLNYNPCCGLYMSSGGGGVGLFGQGSNGAGSTSAYSGACGGSGGSAGSGATQYIGGNGGAYGGGRGMTQNSNYTPVSGNSAGGAVRIVWPGNTRTFPSTCVGAP